MAAVDETFDLLFNLTSEGIIIADAHGVIQRVNPAAAAMLNTTVNSLCNRPASEVFAHRGALLRLFETLPEGSVDLELPRKRIAAAAVVSLTSGGRLVHLRDITEQQHLESRREMLIRAMAHDLRNPISAISGYADLIEKMGPINEAQTQFLNRVRQTTNKLYEVIEALIDLAWIEAGMPLRFMPLRLSGLIDEVIGGLNDAARARSITFAVSVQDPLPLIIGDPARLKLVFRHVIHNALLYSEPERLVAVHVWGDTREVHCKIADQGFGIAEDEIDLIFDRLYRSADERVRALPGGGVGLTLARRILVRHGGQIAVSSALDKGSVFTITLPAAHAQG
ncbi:MAG: HAMP domain-containing sensor histidine kinase [Aggregatilineales bacterium]